MCACVCVCERAHMNVRVCVCGCGSGIELFRALLTPKIFMSQPICPATPWLSMAGESAIV